VAQAAPPKTRVDVDGDGRPEELLVMADGQLAIGARPLGISLETPAWRLSGVEAANAGGQLAIVASYLDERGRGVKPGAGWGDVPAEVVIVGDAGKTLLWRGKIGPADRDDERQVRLDASAGVLLLYETRRDLTRCDGSFLRLHPQRFDPAARRFRPASVAPDTKGATRVVGRELHMGEAIGMMDARTFRAAAATTSEEDEGDIEDLGPPTELDDGDPATVWRKPRGGWGRGEMFVYRAPTARWAVRGLRFIHARHTDHKLARFLLGIGESRFLVELSARTGQWVELPQPIAASCVEITIDAVTEVKGGHTAIAELAVMTERDVDPRTAAAELAERVAAGGDDAAEAERLIRGGGEIMRMALRENAEKRPPEARRRVARALARLGDAEGAGEIAWALRDAEEEEADRLAQALASFGPAAEPALVVLLADETAPIAARARAARLLGKLPGAWQALEPHLGSGPRDLRAAAVAALATRDDAAPALAAAQAADAERAGDAWLVWAKIARKKGARAEPALLAALQRGDLPYPLRYRLAQAAAIHAAAPEVAAALGRALEREREPAIKEAALVVLDPAARPLAEGLVGDPDPGVRAAAIVAASSEGTAFRGASDGWPVVRRAALRHLGATCGGKDAVHAIASRDRDEPTRRTALGLMVQCKDPRAGRTLLAVVRDATLSPPLRAFAAALAADAGDPTLVVALAAELDRLRDEIPYTESEGQIRVAVAIAQALGRLKNPRALEAIARAAADPAVPPIQAAGLTALGELCPVGAFPILSQYARAEDALVARAAKGALRRCRR
jgi:HEAT repeat protein